MVDTSHLEGWKETFPSGKMDKLADDLLEWHLISQFDRPDGDVCSVCSFLGRIRAFCQPVKGLTLRKYVDVNVWERLLESRSGPWRPIEFNPEKDVTFLATTYARISNTVVKPFPRFIFLTTLYREKIVIFIAGNNSCFTQSYTQTIFFLSFFVRNDWEKQFSKFFPRLLDIHLHRIDAREKKIRNNVHANIRIHTFENSKREQQSRRKIRSIKGREWNHGWEQESKLQLERNRRQSAISFWPYNCRPQSPYRNKVQVHRKWSCSLAFALLIELIYIYIYRIWTTTHAFPFLASFLPSEIIAPFATLFLSLPFRFPLRSLTSLFGRGIETSNFEATREQPLPRRDGLISELRHATRHFGTWFFLELGQNCFHDFHVIRYCVPSLVYQKW